MGKRIITYTQRLINPLAPDPSMITIADIAHSLSMVCRFNGHVENFYSVAEHCVHVCDLLPVEHSLAGLLHDASEAYICDLPSPIKSSPTLAGYRIAEDNMMRIIAAEYGFEYPLAPEVVAMDEALLHAELEHLFRGYFPYGTFPDAAKVKIRCWSPKTAEQKFLSRFHDQFLKSK